MRHPLFLSLLLACSASAAETPRQILYGYAAQAARTTPRFEPNAGLGEHLYTRTHAASQRLTSCTTCHAASPRHYGRHAVTGRSLRPLAPSADAGRLVDPIKVERWLARDCMAVFGRECSAGEKADLLAYLTSGD